MHARKHNLWPIKIGFLSYSAQSADGWFFFLPFSHVSVWIRIWQEIRVFLLFFGVVYFFFFFVFVFEKGFWRDEIRFEGDKSESEIDWLGARHFKRKIKVCDISVFTISCQCICMPLYLRRYLNHFFFFVWSAKVIVVLMRVAVFKMDQ